MSPTLTLAIDTASAVCSVALLDGDRVVSSMSEVVGRGHAERLVPMVEAVLAAAGGGRPVRILVDVGPGSFTGVRVGLAAALGMGIGWGVPVAGFSSTAARAAMTFADRPGLGTCVVAINGGHGELFVQRYSSEPFEALGELASLSPVAAAAMLPDAVVIGSGANALVAARGTGEASDAVLDAAGARLLTGAFLLPARPIYGRAPDARPAAAMSTAT